MKTIVPLTVSLTMLALLWLLQGQATNDANNSPPTSGSISKAPESALPSSSPLENSMPGISKQTGARSVKVSEWAIRKAAADNISRLREPLKLLFQHWGLEDAALSEVLGLIHAQHVQRSLARNQHADDMAASTANESDRLLQQRHGVINTHYEAEVLSIIGSTQRLIEMTTLMARVNYDDYKAGAPARKAEGEKVRQMMTAEVARFKAAHGSNYQQVMRERYGDVAAASMLQLGEGADD